MINGPGVYVTLTCSVELNSVIIVESDLPLVMVEVQLSRDGAPLSNPTISSVKGTIFTYTTQLSSFGRSDFGNYSCTATIRPQPTAIYLTGNETVQSNAIIIRAGMQSLLNCNVPTS